MRPIVRMARERDAGTLLALVREHYEAEGRPFAEERARAALRELLGDPSLGRAWLLCDWDAPAGYAVLTLGYSLERGGRDAFLDELYVRAACRGKGLGGRALHVETAKAGEAARSFCRNRGFAEGGGSLMTKVLEGVPA